MCLKSVESQLLINKISLPKIFILGLSLMQKYLCWAYHFCNSCFHFVIPFCPTALRLNTSTNFIICSFVDKLLRFYKILAITFLDSMTLLNFYLIVLSTGPHQQRIYRDLNDGGLEINSSI